MRPSAAVDRVAGRLGVLGGALGMLAGLADVTVGSSMRSWTGEKLDTTGLGLATMFLSAAALAAAIAWQRPGARTGPRRLTTLLALLIPAGTCFTAIGRLWYLPGALLIAAVILMLTASSPGELVHAVDRHRWLGALTALLGAFYVFLGADALPKPVGVLGIIGGVAIWAALVAARGSRRAALGLLVAGALPFAAVTWWSAVTPLIAILVLTVGLAAIAQRDPSVSA